jgi:pyruvate kinase
MLRRTANGTASQQDEDRMHFGPVSKSPEILEGMMWAGMNVARLNFSHGDHPFSASRMDHSRELPGIDMPGASVFLRDLSGA